MNGARDCLEGRTVVATLTLVVRRELPETGGIGMADVLTRQDFGAVAVAMCDGRGNPPMLGGRLLSAAGLCERRVRQER